MYQTFLHAKWIEQERRALILFFIMLVPVLLLVELVFVTFFFPEHRLELMLPYLFSVMTLPVWIPLLKDERSKRIKYLVFLSFTVSNFAIEIYLFLHTSSLSIVGRFAEIYFLLFAPIFVNKRFFFVVFGVTMGKYLMHAVILDSVEMFFPVGPLLILSVIAMVILFRFRKFVSVMNASIYRQFEGVVKGIVSMIELKVPYMKGHSERVAHYAVALAKQLNVFTKDELDLIYQACLLHDVGKIHVPEHILCKPDKLTEEEMEIVKRHPSAGVQAIRHIQGYEKCADIILYHHERWDGKGYPEGLREKQIPLMARIVAIADAFDAMTTRNACREAMSAEEALAELCKGKGSQFDPALVEHVEKHFAEWTSLLARFQSESNPHKARQHA